MAVTTQPSTPVGAAVAPVAQRAKNALRRLAMDKLEPTPENYAIAYRMESGGARPAALPPEALGLVQRLAGRAMGDDGEARAINFCKALAEAQWDRADSLLGDSGPDGRQLAALIDRVVRGVERGGRQWTLARKKDSLQRVLDGSRSDARRMQQRLGQLMARWESDTPDDAVETELAASLGLAARREPDSQIAGPNGGLEAMTAPAAVPTSSAAAMASAPANPIPALAWGRLLTELVATVTEALPATEVSGKAAAQQLGDLAQRIQGLGATPDLVDEMVTHCEGTRRLLQHRHHLVEQLGQLCHELTASLTELAEDDSWAKGQCDAMRVTLEDGITARGVKSVTELLRNTRGRQSQMRLERNRARDALKSLINRMLGELGELGSQTGRFHESVGRYADVIEQSESLETLTGVVREMVEESHTVQALVAMTRQRLNEEHTKASGLTQRVNELEGELQRLSGEVSTDQLTQVANRRGLLRDFEVARARADRQGASLAMGLLDIDNFKRLNDELGHNAGDEALKSLAALVKNSLRPSDTVARYGGEEFVVLLPDTSTADAQMILTRLQRTLSGGLFMHEQKNVMVTFSAGVTGYRKAERIEDSLERADQALFEAKRTGKNRTCAA
jgi:diguanylate cyclase